MTAIASVFVEIRPDTSKFGGTLTSTVSSDAKKAGTVAGGDMKAAFLKGASGASAKVGVDEASAKAGGRKAGKAAGKAAEDAAGSADVGGELADSVGGGAGLSKMKAAGATAGLAVAAGLAAGLASAINTEAANDKLAAQLGLGARRSKVLGQAAGDLYSNAYGESLEGVNDALRAVMLNIPKMATAATPHLKDVAAKVLDIASAFDQDSDAITRAAGQMVRSGMAKNAKDAFDVITAGFQSGVDKSEDFLDTLNEYGNQFEKLGLDGATATGLLSQGLQAGARDADQVADSLKEFSIRAVDGSTSTSSAFKQLGLDGTEMTDAIAAGGKSAADATALTLEKLRDMENPVKRSRVAVKLFGTQAEDLGDALYALDPKHATDALGKVGGAAKKMGTTLNDNASANITAFSRQAKTFAVNIIGGYVIPALTDFAGYLNEHLGPAAKTVVDWFREHWPEISQALKDAMGWFRKISAAGLDMSGYLINAFADFLDAVLWTFGEVIDAADWAFGWIPGIGDDIGRAKDDFHEFADKAVNNLHTVGDGLHGVADMVRGIPDPEIKTGSAQAAVSGLAQHIKNQLAGIKDEGVGINLTTRAESVMYTLQHTHGYLGGGAVSGAGTGTSDSIPALLSNGEHVITADEVKKAGGHKVWEGLRRLAMHGSLQKVGDVGRFAGGGAVINPSIRDSGSAAAISTASSRFAGIASRIGSAVSSAVSAVIETMSPAIRGLDFAKAQVGKPYVWGGVGPGGYDCSGYMSAIANASVGRNPYSRLGTSAGTPWPGFAGGITGDPGFSTASTPNYGGSGIGHVWGRIAGVGVESSGGQGPHVGNTLSLGDSHASAFQHQVYDKGGILSPGYTLAYNGTGADEYVARFAKGGKVSRADRRANRQDAAEAVAEAAADAAQAAAEALRSLEKVFKHFGFGDRAGADTIKDQLRTLTQALVGVFGKDGHIVKAVQATSAALMGVAKDRDHTAAALDRSQSKLASLIIARQTLEKDIAGGFNTTVYGDGGQTTAAGLFMSARAEINDAKHFKKVLQRLKAKGLAPSILKALALAGPSAIVQAESLAALSPRKLNQYEDLLQQGNRLESSLGGVVGSAVYNQQIAEQRKQTHKLNHELGQLNRRIEHLDDRIEHAVERALNHVRIELDGKRVDRALADHTHRRQRTGS